MKSEENKGLCSCLVSPPLSPYPSCSGCDLPTLRSLPPSLAQQTSGVPGTVMGHTVNELQALPSRSLSPLAEATGNSHLIRSEHGEPQGGAQGTPASLPSPLPCSQFPPASTGHLTWDIAIISGLDKLSRGGSPPVPGGSSEPKGRLASRKGLELAAPGGLPGPPASFRPLCPLAPVPPYILMFCARACGRTEGVGITEGQTRTAGHRHEEPALHDLRGGKIGSQGRWQPCSCPAAAKLCEPVLIAFPPWASVSSSVPLPP